MTTKTESSEKKGISRRTFLNRTTSGAAFLALAPVPKLFASGELQDVKPWPADAPQFRFHMIGQAHIDPVWLWPWSEGIAVVHSTFRSALDRMNETPDFCFTASSAQFYDWVAENDPKMLEEIRKRVKEGRWDTIGGWWVEPDVNMPSGEAMVRQGLYGQLTFQKLLGRRATVGYNPDSFGHTGNLPQILKLQGIQDYVFMRPQPQEKKLPADLFWWESPDGSRVLTARIPLSYNDSGPLRNRIQEILKEFPDEPMKSFMAFYGAGDHGGGATKENIKSINELKTEKGAPVIFYSTTDRYFKEMRDDKAIQLPVVKDDLQHHSVGCYTADSEIKKGNRQSEAALVTAEKIAGIGAVAWGANYPKQEFTKAWQRVLFLQFHDSLAGTSLFEHSQNAREGHGFALDTAHQATYLAAQKLEWQIAAEDPESLYLVVFNPHAWEVLGNIEYDSNRESQYHKSSRVDDEKGNALPHQWTAGQTETGTRKKLVVQTPIPAMGYRQIRLHDAESPELKSVAKADKSSLENELIKVNISSSGTIGIVDKKTGRQLFAGGETGCRGVMINDESDTWSHDVVAFDDEIGVFGNATIKVLENGPLRATIRTVSTYGVSTLTIDWMLYAGSKNLEARVTLDWHEQHKMLKFSFPVDLESPVATYETSYAHIVRANNGEEDPGQRWIDVSGTKDGQPFGFSLINDAKYGYSVPGSDLRLSVARSAPYAHHRPKVLDPNTEHLWQDQGIQTFRMLLVPHKGTWQEAGVARLAEEFVSQPVAIYQGIHSGTMPKSGSFLSVDVPNVIVSAVKESENGEDTIIRCVETSGNPVTATLDLAFANKKWSGSFRPCEIKTLRVSRKGGNVREVNLLEE